MLNPGTLHPIVCCVVPGSLHKDALTFELKVGNGEQPMLWGDFAGRGGGDGCRRDGSADGCGHCRHNRVLHVT